MRIATINGLQSQALDHDRTVAVIGLNLEASSLVFDLELSCHCAGQVVWSTRVDQLGPNPVGSRPTYSELDYDFVVCVDANVLVLSGWSRSVILSLSTGAILGEVELQFGDVSSLNFLYVQPVQSLVGGLLIVSGAKMERFDRSIRLLWSWDPPGAISKCEASGELVIAYTLDWENLDRPYRKTEIQVDSGRVVSSVLISKME